MRSDNRVTELRSISTWETDYWMPRGSDGKTRKQTKIK